MQLPEKLNKKRFTLGGAAVVGTLFWFSRAPLVGLFTLVQWIALLVGLTMVEKLVRGANKGNQGVFWLFMLKSALTFLPFIFVGIFAREILLWCLLSYILILLIFFISIKKDG